MSEKEKAIVEKLAAVFPLLPAARAKIDPLWELIYSRAASQNVSTEQLAKMTKRWGRATMYEKMAARTVSGWPIETVLSICSGLRIPIEELREKLRY